jgi:phenylacetate-CoA ligase
MVVTSLGRDNPMIRYDLEDVVRVDPTPCPCGETSRRAFWEGRQRDVVWVDGHMILPIDVWTELPAGTEFVLVRRPDCHRLEVRVEGGVPADLAGRLAAKLEVPVDLVNLAAGTLPRAAYKQVLVVDEPPLRNYESSRS